MEDFAIRILETQFFALPNCKVQLSAVLFEFEDNADAPPQQAILCV